MRNDPMTKTYQTHDPDFTAASPRRSLLKNGKPRTKIRAPSLELRSLSLGSHHQFIFSELRTTISQGALCAFITRSRLRKNALLDLLAGRRIPDQGLCLLNGVKASDLPIEKKNRIGLLLREDRLYETMTVGQVAVFFSGCFSGWKNELYFRLISAIGATKKAKVSNLGFERRTVLALAVLLAGNPDMLILDEYFTELGGEMRDLFFREIKQFHARPGKTVIIVGHQPGLLPHLVDTLIFVGRSMLVHIATAELDGWSPSAGSRNMGDNRLGGATPYAADSCSIHPRPAADRRAAYGKRPPHCNQPRGQGVSPASGWDRIVCPSNCSWWSGFPGLCSTGCLLLCGQRTGVCIHSQDGLNNALTRCFLTAKRMAASFS